MLERLFRLRESDSSLSTEAIAGLTTFMTMAYIIFANTDILKAATGPGYEAALAAATCLAAALPTLLMGLYSNYPFALAPGMGLNAFLAFEICKGRGYPWQVGMGVVCVEGVIITVLVITGLREIVMQAIPLGLKRAIGVGIGLFIAFIGLQKAGLVTDHPVTLVTSGSLRTPEAAVALLGLLVTIVLMARGVRGAMLVGIAAATLAAFPLGVAQWPQKVVQIPDLSSVGQMDILGALKPELVPIIFAFMITDFFDTMGTVIGIGGEAGFLDAEGNLPRLRQVLLVDSLAAVWGGSCGASSVTTYIESASGVAAGGRTGLTAVVVGLLFLLASFLGPLASVVPAAAVAPALIVVGYLMITVVADIPLRKFEEALPAFIILLTIPLTYSISHGIGFGFIAYTVTMLVTGRIRQVHPFMLAVSVVFVLVFLLT